MSSNSVYVRQLNVNENYSSFTQSTPMNTGDSLHHTYHAWKWDVDAEYWGRVKMALSTHVSSINKIQPTSEKHMKK